MMGKTARWLALGLAPALALTGWVGVETGTAQEAAPMRAPEATIYRDAYFSGPAVFVDQARPDLGLAWPVNSIRIASGRWELCERRNFQGTCRTYDRDEPMLASRSRGLTIQSIRPVRQPGGSGIGGGFFGVQARNVVARGTFAEFHTEPDERGYRVLACPTGRVTAFCTSRTADSYCRSRGWTRSEIEHRTTINRREYLADVLCVR